MPSNLLRKEDIGDALRCKFFSRSRGVFAFDQRQARPPVPGDCGRVDIRPLICGRGETSAQQIGYRIL